MFASFLFFILASFLLLRFDTLFQFSPLLLRWHVQCVYVCVFACVSVSVALFVFPLQLRCCRFTCCLLCLETETSFSFTHIRSHDHTHTHSHSQAHKLNGTSNSHYKLTHFFFELNCNLHFTDFKFNTIFLHLSFCFNSYFSPTRNVENTDRHSLTLKTRPTRSTVFFD